MKGWNKVKRAIATLLSLCMVFGSASQLSYALADDGTPAQTEAESEIATHEDADPADDASDAGDAGDTGDTGEKHSAALLAQSDIEK